MTDEQPQVQEQQQITSTTAPGRIFASRAELAAHYQTAWHRYNLKRREAGLPVLLETDFEARWAAAQAVHTERLSKGKHKPKHSDDASAQNNGTNHLKQGKSRKLSKAESSAAAVDATQMNDAVESSDVASTIANVEPNSNLVEIDPRQCLFDRHTAVSVESNVARMHRKYGFFVPDREYLTDLEGLIGYCHEKIQLGAVCLYCHRSFRSPRSCQQHMRSKVHTKLRYEVGIDLEDIDVFYDFSEADAAFWNSTKASRPLLEQQKESNEAVAVSDDDDEVENGDEEDDDDDDDDWEDVSDDEEADGDDNEDDDVFDMDDDEKEMYRGYEEEVARMGFNVTPLGELVFPDGRIVGHRGFRRYYKQRLPQHKETSPAVAAARQAAGERLYRGRVYQIGNGQPDASRSGEDQTKNYALVMAGIAPGTAAGRAGRGLLVSSVAGNGSTYTQVSVYRYRAAMNKQRRGERAGQLIHHRTATNMNRMDKKANRLINNVSVAHAKR